MDYLPKGLKIENVDNKVIIKTDKKELVFSDYFGIFFCCFGIAFWIFGLFDKGLTDFFIVFSVVFWGLIGYLLISLIFSFHEYQTITITDGFIEISKKRIFFSSKNILDRKLISKVDFKELRFPILAVPSILILLKFVCNFGYYKIPRILYKENDYYIFEHYKKDIRVWIIDYLK